MRDTETPLSSEQRGQLEEIVNEGNLARIFKDIADLGRRIDVFATHYAAKSNGVARHALPPSPVSLESILGESRSNPYRVQALLQAMAFGCTPEMLVMIWMSELGCTIQNLALVYERRKHVALDIKLRLLDKVSTLDFRSTEVWDLAVLRLVGLATSDDAPDMSGFYPLSLPVSPE